MLISNIMSFIDDGTNDPATNDTGTNDTGTNDTGTNDEGDILVLDPLLIERMKMEGWLYLFPTLLLLVHYIYLLHGLVKKRIWKSKPFYLAFVVLGVSDCIILVWHTISYVQMITHMNFTSSIGTTIMIVTTDCLYLIAWSFSCCCLGIISALRCIAVYFPMFYHNNIEKISGIIVASTSMIFSILPIILGFSTVIPIITGERVLIVDSSMEENVNMSGYHTITGMIIFIIWPMLMGAVLPLVLYCSIALKLKFLSPNINHNGKQQEYTFLLTGLCLSLCSLIVHICFVILIFAPIFELEMTLSMYNALMAVMSAAEIVTAGINPFIYWIVDSSFKQILPPAWEKVGSLLKRLILSAHPVNTVAPGPTGSVPQPINAMVSHSHGLAEVK